MTPAPPPSGNLTLSDRATILTIVTAVAGVITAAWPGHDVAPFIQPVALAIAGLAPVVLIFSKHHYAQGITAVATVVATATPSATAPVSVSPALVMAATQAARAAADAAAAVSATLAGLGAPPPAAAVPTAPPP